MISQLSSKDITNIVRLSPVENIDIRFIGPFNCDDLLMERQSAVVFVKLGMVDEAGNIVPPGHYVVSIQLRAGTGPVREVKMDESLTRDGVV